MGRVGLGGAKKEMPSPQMVLDVMPNSKMLLVSPSASNKIAGHPERPQEGEGRLLSPLAPGPQQLCSVGAAQSPAVTGFPCWLLAPVWPPFSHCAACLAYVRLYLVFGLPGVLATGQFVTGPCSAIRRPVHHQQGCLGKLSHITSGCIQEKQESLVVLFLAPFFNAIQVWRFPQTGKCLPFKSQPATNNQLTLRAAVTLSQDLKLWIFYNFHIVPPFFLLDFISLHQESRKSFQLVVKDD